MKTDSNRNSIGRRPSQSGPKVMIPWRVSPRLVERLRWQAAKQGLQPSKLLSQIIERNAPPV
jgi:predicted DNA binding CopG/RHH family protein